MRLRIEKQQTKPGIITMIPRGPLSGETYSVFDLEVSRIIEEPIKILVIDMQCVDFITSAGVGAIVKAKTSLAEKGADLAMVNLQPQVQKVFEIIRLLPQIGVFQDRDELDEYLGKVQRRMTGEEN